MSQSKNKLSTLQLALFSTGGMIGCGWLFSPFYGFQVAGVWVLLSWIITAILTFIIALSFAEVSSLLPIVGGVSRFIGVTHNKTVAFVFLALSWLSLAVYLPLEAQSAIQYLGFWWKDLVIHDANHVTLSKLGLLVAVAVIIGLTWLNSFLISRVTKINSAMGVWKMIIPVGVALIIIGLYGKWEHVITNAQHVKFSAENILLAITSSGLAFAFTGFQNGLILSNNAKNPAKALPYSLFAPILLGGLIYMLISLAFITGLSDPSQISNASVAPLLGLVVLFSINIVYITLFADAILAPLGTANVYTAITGRVLYGLARDFMPKSIFIRLNKYEAPYICLWLSAAIGICFLLPFPTWRQLVDFLSSIVIFAYLSGPIALIILRQELPDAKRDFRVKYHKLIGYIGFACCSLLIYWSDLANLCFLSIALIATVLLYALVSKTNSFITVIKHSWVLISYVLSMTLVSYLHSLKLIAFPADNMLIIVLALIFCKLLLVSHSPSATIKENLAKLNLEIGE